MKLKFFGSWLVVNPMQPKPFELMLHQNLVQKQQLKIHPLQLQMLNLFHLNTIELEQRIQQELEENPIIEEKKEEVEPAEAADDLRREGLSPDRAAVVGDHPRPDGRVGEGAGNPEVELVA